MRNYEMNTPSKRKRIAASVTALSFILASCGGGGGSDGGSTNPPPVTPKPIAGFVIPAQESLSVADVQKVLAQGISEAKARSKPASLAVVDRVGNVLAVFVMNGANPALSVPKPSDGSTFDLQGVNVPGAVAGAIAKAITGAYLSSAGNAFTTRTASQIVQEHFPPSPTTIGLESGPLFGVQFSQLPCSDFASRFTSGGGAGALIGPKRSPLGLSADAGGIPLYKNGVVVGAVGVMADGVYDFDPNILDTDTKDEEFIAVAATTGFAAPEAIRANQITVDGTSLRFSDATPSGLISNPATAPGFATVNGVEGALTSVNGYYSATGGVVAGTAYGTEASGIRRSTSAEFSNTDAYVFTDGSGNNRFPIRAGTDASTNSNPLTAAEVRAVMEEAFLIVSRARGQIRKPLDSRAEVTISMVDTQGAILGMIRSPDAPIFGSDVSLQKARTAAFFSNAQAGNQLLGNPSADVQGFVGKVRTFLNDPNALTGAIAFADRSGGNLSRPYFPDGEVGRPNGPLSRPFASFNPFSTGLQSALVKDNILQHVGFILGTGTDTPQRCTSTPDVSPGQNRLQNGIQIFPGSVPIYRGSQLVGAIGVSGDGIDQDDMIGFLGLNNAGKRLGSIGNAPTAIRADTILVPVSGASSVRLRYIRCPIAPFLDSDQQNVCDGL